MKQLQQELRALMPLKLFGVELAAESESASVTAIVVIDDAVTASIAT